MNNAPIPKAGTRINETGGMESWGFQYDENKKDDDSPQSVFLNKKYAIHFIDHSSGDTTSAQGTLKVTQDAFDETWYTITAPKDLVKADTDAWNTSAVTIQPTDQAITKDLKERTYTKIIDDGKKDKGDIAHPETWSWADTIVHTKDDGTGQRPTVCVSVIQQAEHLPLKVMRDALSVWMKQHQSSRLSV